MTLEMLSVVNPAVCIGWGVAILDVPIPGLAPWVNVATSNHVWHFDFHKPIMAESFTKLGATDVATAGIDNAGHWLAEEQPDATAAIIAEFAAQLSGR